MFRIGRIFILRPKGEEGLTVENSPKDPARALPGYRKKSFSLPFAGGEIWVEHLDGLFGFADAALEKLEADRPAFLRPSSPSLAAFVLDQTEVTEALARGIAQALSEPKKRWMRVAFIGADRRTRAELVRLLGDRSFAEEFFSDFEKAKEWLVREGA